MAITYGALKAQIQAEVNRPSAANLTYIGNAILTAIRYYEAKPIYFTEAKTTLTLTSGLDYVDISALGLKRINTLRILKNGKYMGESNGFTGVTHGQLEEIAVDPTLSRTPSNWALLGNKIYFDCLADQDYTLSMSYNQGDLTYPSADNDVSIWFEEGQDIIRYHATGVFYNDKLHAPELGNPALQNGQAYYDNLVQRNVMRSHSNGMLS